MRNRRTVHGRVPSRRPAHLERTAAGRADNDAADDAGDHADGQGLLRRRSRSNGDAHAQRQGHEEDYDGRQQIVPERAQPSGRGGREDWAAARPESSSVTMIICFTASTLHEKATYQFECL